MVPDVSKEQIAFIIKESYKHSMTASLKIWMVCSFRTSGINNPTTQNNKPEDLNPQHR